LVRGQPQAEKILRQEEERFRETLEQGLKLLEEDLRDLEGTIIPGETVFKLYDTYGFPVDLTADIARERDLEVDTEGFDRAMAEQRERARAASSFKADHGGGADYEGSSEFTGYEHLRDSARVDALYAGGRAVNALETGEEGMIILDRTPFYAESGGQVGDRGTISGEGFEFDVQDTVKYGDAHGHVGVVRQGRVQAGDGVTAHVDEARRQATVLNHSATHLLHAALREILGEHVTQKGSLVAPDRLRFDFGHFEPVSAEQVGTIERRVNEWIRANEPADVRHMAYDEAIDFGAVALFGEKYGDDVRVMRFGEFSTELCGGTHVGRTGDIGFFKIISEVGISAGVRRIEAVTGEGALAWAQGAERRIDAVAERLRASPENIEVRLGQVLDRNRELEKELEQARARLASQTGSDLVDKAVEVGGVRVLA
ncbi:alanine--tRNA ligase-related protein, partial [Arhodomonas sp. KWT]